MTQPQAAQSHGDEVTSGNPTQHMHLEKGAFPVGDDGFCEICREGTITNTAELIAARQKEYGGFKNNSKLTQDLYNLWLDALLDAGRIVNDAQKEGMHMLFHKISRFTFGIPETARKHTEDMCGYCELFHEHTP